MHSETHAVIETSAELEQLVERLGDEVVCAIDTEADSLHRFKESLCLIQFAWEDKCLLIDPLAIDDLSSLNRLLRTATVWMHGADYDMTMLRREFGVLPKVVFDTQIGARLLGVRKFGLANLVEHYFDVKLSKTSQKADWGKRPLPPKMVEYALNDVRYLLPMGEMIVAALKDKGRYEWFVESCEAAQTKVLERDDSRDDPWRIQGSGRLDRNGLNFLRSLWHWRNEEAEAWDKPSFMVLTNRQMLEWSVQLSEGKKVNFPGHFRPERRKRLNQTLSEAVVADQSTYPPKLKSPRRRRDPDFETSVNELLKRRDGAAEKLDIEPSLIASRSVIELIATREEMSEEPLLSWQKSLLGLDHDIVSS